MSSRFPFILIRVQPATSISSEFELEALIDTGFDGDVVLPEVLQSRFGQPLSYMNWRLADGSEVLTPSYQVSVDIGIGESIRCRASLLGSEAFLGRGFLNRYRVILDHGREVVVEP